MVDWAGGWLNGGGLGRNRLFTHSIIALPFDSSSSVLIGLQLRLRYSDFSPTPSLEIVLHSNSS